MKHKRVWLIDTNWKKKIEEKRFSEIMLELYLLEKTVYDLHVCIHGVDYKPYPEDKEN